MKHLFYLNYSKSILDIIIRMSINLNTGKTEFINADKNSFEELTGMDVENVLNALTMGEAGQHLRAFKLYLR